MGNFKSALTPRSPRSLNPINSTDCLYLVPFDYTCSFKAVWGKCSPKTNKRIFTAMCTENPESIDDFVAGTDSVFKTLTMPALIKGKAHTLTSANVSGTFSIIFGVNSY